MGCWVRLALVLSFLVLTPPLLAQTTPRRPRGIYAVVNIEENIKKEQAANPSITPAELKSLFRQSLPGSPGQPGGFGAGAVGELGLRSTPILRPPPTLTTGLIWMTPSTRLRRGMPGIRRRLRKRSSSFLCRVFRRPNGCWLRFPVATGCFGSPVQTPPSDVRKGDLCRFRGRTRRERTTDAVEPLV